ncbi:MAG: hypothetical protein R3B70_28845 [Polyangiaceae bacterium]
MATAKTAKTAKKPASPSPATPEAPEMPAGAMSFPYAPPVYSPAAGKKALAALGPEMAAISDAALGNLRLDVEAATFAALGVAGFVGAPEVKARFLALPDTEFDKVCVTGLESACFATLYAIAEARAAGALETEARIPPELAAEAAEVEGRMQALCEYYFSDDPEIRPELDRLRPGVGHRDLANDLLGYARIYEKRAAAVKVDTRYYRPGDAARAKELAGLFIQALSAASTPRAREAFATYARAWTILSRRYDEVRAAGLWLFRKEAAREERFPSLFVAGRGNVGRPKRAPGGDETASGEPGAGAGAETTPAVEPVAGAPG